MALSFNPATAVASIKAHFYAAAQYPTLFQEGLAWYFTAEKLAKTMALRNRVSTETVVAVIAVLSPNNKWQRNLVDAENCLRAVASGGNATSFKSSTYGQNKEKACLLARGQSPKTVLGGNKVKAFYANILMPTEVYTVTVDGHAVSIAIAVRTPLSKIPQLSDKQYKTVADAYRRACEEINEDSLQGRVLPSQVQAVTWSYYRFLHNLS